MNKISIKCVLFKYVPLPHSPGKQIFLHRGWRYNNFLSGWNWKKMCHRGFTRYRLENELQLTRKWTRKLSEIEFGMYLRNNELLFFSPESSLRIFINYVVWSFTEVLNGILKELSTRLGDSLTFHPGSIFFTRTTNFCAFFHRDRSSGQIWLGLWDRGYLSSLFGAHFLFDA